MKQVSIIFLGLAALTLSACTPTSSGGHPEVVSNVVEYANATCLFGAQDGDRAINSLAMTKNIARAAFGKEFNISRLLGVGTASVDETIRYIGDLGVNV